jgi:N utilization substance protein B
VCKKAHVDLLKRQQKHRPTEEDKAFKDHLYNNSLVKNLEQNTSLNKRLTRMAFSESVNDSYMETIYLEFSKTEPYKEYLTSAKNNIDHLNILLELYRFCRQNELFNDVMEDHYGVWQDDKSVVIGAIKKTLKRLPETDDEFYMEYYPSDETVRQFGYELFSITLKSDEALLNQIEPTLKNWDSERLAVIDMILLKMATCEFINFETIPATVTINEYVDIAKNYSTAKSKEFINGVLDRVMNDLIESGVMAKDSKE